MTHEELRRDAAVVSAALALVRVAVARADRGCLAGRHQAEEIIRHGHGPLPSDRHGDCDDEDEEEDESRFGGRPVVVDRNHPSWAEVNAEQQERIGGPAAD